MMRFRKQWLAKFNTLLTNRITGLFAGYLPGFGILPHVGRKSGKTCRTPSTYVGCQLAFPERDSIRWLLWPNINRPCPSAHAQRNWLRAQPRLKSQSP